MPIQRFQDNANTIRSVFQGNWTWDEFYEDQAAVLEFLDQAETTANMIVDLRESSALPSGALGHLKNIKTSKHPKLDVTILVGANMMMQIMGKMMRTLSSYIPEQVFVNTVEEAHEYLAQKMPNEVDNTKRE